MTTENAAPEGKITLDGVDYPISQISDKAKATLVSLQFVEAQLRQLRNEWAIADTARLAYSAALKREVARGA